MKAVLISIQPKWCEKIASSKKTIEVRKTKPSIPTPFKCYIYCCKAKSQWRYSDYEGAYENSEGEIVYAQQHVIGEFICDKISKYPRNYEFGYEISEKEFNETALTAEQFVDYGNGDPLYGWHISNLKIYDKPKALWQFYKCGAKSFKELCDTGEICEYCKYSSHGLYLCEGRFCDETYEVYLDNNFTLTSPPQSWCYVQELEELEK